MARPKTDPYHTPEREKRDVAKMADISSWPVFPLNLKRCKSYTEGGRVDLEFATLRRDFLLEEQDGKQVFYNSAQEVYDDGWRVD